MNTANTESCMVCLVELPSNGKGSSKIMCTYGHLICRVCVTDMVVNATNKPLTEYTAYEVANKQVRFRCVGLDANSVQCREALDTARMLQFCRKEPREKFEERALSVRCDYEREDAKKEAEADMERLLTARL